MANVKNEIATAVKVYFHNRMPSRICDLHVEALRDLWDGPGSHDEDADWPGYTTALEELREWMRDNLHECWVDLDCGAVSEDRPDGYHDGDEWVEPDLANVWHLEQHAVRRIMFGTLITEGGL